MFAEFYEISSLPFLDIEKPKRHGQTGRTDRYETVYPPQTQFAGGINTTLFYIAICMINMYDVLLLYNMRKDKTSRSVLRSLQLF